MVSASPVVAKNKAAIRRRAKKVGADMAVVELFLTVSPEAWVVNGNSAKSRAPYWNLANGVLGLGLRFRDVYGEEPRTWIDGHGESTLRGGRQAPTTWADSRRPIR